MAGPRSATRLFWSMGGMIVWAAQFTVAYGATSVICARGYGGTRVFGFGVVPLTIAVVTLVSLAATGIIFVVSSAERRRLSDTAGHPTDRFLNTTALLVSGLSLIAIAWTGLPGLILPACF